MIESKLKDTEVRPQLNGSHIHSENIKMESILDTTKNNFMNFTLIILLFTMNMLIIPIACISTLFVFYITIRIFSLSLFNRLEHELCRLVNDSWMTAAKLCCGHTVKEYGDDIRSIADRRCLCLVNHLTLADHFTLMTAFHNKGALAGRYLWVIYHMWKWNPIGLMWILHGNYFVQGSGIGVEKRAQVLQDFRSHLKKNFKKNDYGWVVMYPEGSRLFLVREKEKKFCAQNNLLPFRHCSHPRVGAAHTVLNTCGPLSPHSSKSDINNEPIGYIVDCTLGYYKGLVPDFSKICLGEWPTDEGPASNTVAFHYRIHPVRPEWCGNDSEKFKEWLYEQYKIKDELLDNFYRTGNFCEVENGIVNTSKALKGRPVQVSLLRCAINQILWSALFYFHYKFWLRKMLLFSCRIIYSMIF